MRKHTLMSELQILFHCSMSEFKHLEGREKQSRLSPFFFKLLVTLDLTVDSRHNLYGLYTILFLG